MLLGWDAIIILRHPLCGTSITLIKLARPAMEKQAPKMLMLNNRSIVMTMIREFDFSLSVQIDNASKKIEDANKNKALRKPLGLSVVTRSAMKDRILTIPVTVLIKIICYHLFLYICHDTID